MYSWNYFFIKVTNVIKFNIPDIFRFFICLYVIFITTNYVMLILKIILS